MDDKLTVLLTKLRQRFDLLYGERLVRMVFFSSQGRGDAEPDSDIDVLVVLQRPVGPGEEIAHTGELTAAFSLEHDVVISRVFISSEQFFAEQSPLLLNVRGEGISLTVYDPA
jgi:predicted nucleotidyltransferase